MSWFFSAGYAEGYSERLYLTFLGETFFLECFGIFWMMLKLSRMFRSCSGMKHRECLGKFRYMTGWKVSVLMSTLILKKCVNGKWPKQNSGGKWMSKSWNARRNLARTEKTMGLAPIWAIKNTSADCLSWGVILSGLLMLIGVHLPIYQPVSLDGNLFMAHLKNSISAVRLRAVECSAGPFFHNHLALKFGRIPSYT